MLMCNDTVTLVRHVKLQDGDRYECITVTGASWYAKTAVVSTAKGLVSGNVLKCRIPDGLLPVGKPPRKDDYMVRGAISHVSSPAGLKGREYFRITAIGDNRRGRNPHWVVSGS